MPDSFSIVVPTSDRARYLGPALLDLLDQKYPCERFEVVVVDDSETAGVRALVKEIALGGAVPVRYEHSGGGRGPNAARNVGIERSGGDIVAFVDDDCRFTRGWLRNLAEGIDRSPGVECYGGPIAVWLEPGHPRWCGREPFPITSLDHGPSDRYVDLVFSANMAVPRAAFDRHGLFDAGLPIYGDETEWVLRLRRAGGLVWYVAAAGVTHTRLATDLTPRGMLGAAGLRGVRAAEFDRAEGLAPPRELTARAALRTSLHAAGRGCWSAAAHGVEKWAYLAQAARLRRGAGSLPHSGRRASM